MANYLDYAGLQKYDAKIKAFIETLDTEVVRRGAVSIEVIETGLPEGIAKRYVLSQDKKYESKTAAGTFITYAEYKALVDAYKADQKKETPTLPDPATLYTEVSVEIGSIDIPEGADLSAIEEAIGKHTVEGEEVLYNVSDRIKAEAKDGIYKAATAEGEDDVTLGGAIEAIETKFGSAELNAYQGKDNLVDIVNVLTGDDTTEGSIVKVIYDNAQDAKYGEGTYIAEYALISDPSQKITVAEYEALSEDDKALYQPVEKPMTIKKAIESAVSAGEVTIDDSQTETGYLKTYTFAQNGAEIGKINIPKDFLVKSGKVVEFTKDDAGKYYKDGVEIPALPEGVTDETLGKYIELVINVKDDSATESTVYIFVKDLVDVYTVAEKATEVQLAIDSNNVISATLVDAVEPNPEDPSVVPAGITTAKIRDKQVTLGKLSQEVQDMLVATGGALVYKGEATELPKTGAVGDLYKIGDATKGYKAYACVTASVEDPAADAVYVELAIDEAFLTAVVGTGYVINQPDGADPKAVTVKEYIDSRIFVGTQAQVDAKKAAGEIDETTFVVITDEDPEELSPITDEEIEDLFD